MNLIMFAITYIQWHYTRGVRNLIAIVSNLFVFVIHFFSMPVMAVTLFAPWRRLGEDYKKGFDPAAMIETLIVNLIMRGLGICLRVAVLTLGLIALSVVSLLGVVAIVLWLVWPALIILFLINGLYLILR